MAGFTIPEHDLITVDRPEPNVEEFTYSLGGKVVLICTVRYTDEMKRDIESVEYSDGT